MNKYITIYNKINNIINVNYDGKLIEITPQKYKLRDDWNYYEIEIDKKISLNNLKNIDTSKLKGNDIYFIPINLFRNEIIYNKLIQNSPKNTFNNVCNNVKTRYNKKPNIFKSIKINNDNSINLDQKLFTYDVSYTTTYNILRIFSDYNNNKIVIKSGNIDNDIYIINKLNQLNIQCNNILPMRVYKNKYIIMDYMDGTLRSLSKNNNIGKEQLTKYQLLNILLQINNILICLKKKNMCYLNLHTDNILYKCTGTNEYIIMLGDLGGMQELNEKSKINIKYNKFVNYNYDYYDTFDDYSFTIKKNNENQMIWSFGILILELLNYKVKNEYIFNLNYINTQEVLFTIIDNLIYKKKFMLYLKKLWDNKHDNENIYYYYIIFNLKNKNKNKNINKSESEIKSELVSNMFKNINDNNDYIEKHIDIIGSDLISIRNIVADDISNYLNIAVGEIKKQLYINLYKENAKKLQNIGYNNIQKLYLAVTSYDKPMTLLDLQYMIKNMMKVIDNKKL